MIQIKEKKDCCGCGACLQICPKQCVSFSIDEEGFKYPVVDDSKCADCHLCEKVCPMLNRGEYVEHLSTEAVVNTNEAIRLDSSSGGLFTALAEYIVSKGGVVFGGSYNNEWTLEHTYTRSAEGIAKYRGSKYLQSDTKQTYNEVLEFLQQGKLVLYTGTPCQIRGLLLFLGKPYGNLYTVDVICHGVPSPLVFKAYLRDVCKQYGRSFSDIKDYRFRDKQTGWKHYCQLIEFTDGTKQTFSNSSFMKGFLTEPYARPSCHNCPARNQSSGSDITLGDFWGIQEHYPEYDDDKGTGLLAVKTEKAKELMNNVPGIERHIVEKQKAFSMQPFYFRSAQEGKYRAEFWASDWQNDFCNVVDKITSRVSVKQWLFGNLIKVLQHIGIFPVLKTIKDKILYNR